MSLTYGFYNAYNHDRRYDAIQMSSIFDGVINDGIFMSIGDRFEVTSLGTDMFVTVGSGRAWFNHTWTLNDALLPIEIPQSELILDRYDAIILEVNAEQAVRANSIKVLKGTPSSNPVYPTLTNTLTVHQYPLAYIYVGRDVTSIRQADITSMIGKGSTPYVTGIIETINIESMVKQWEDQWRKFFEEQSKDMDDTNTMWKEQWIKWFEEFTTEMDQSAEKWRDLWHEWYHMYTNSSQEEFTNWKNEQKADFLQWFNDLKDLLTDQVESMLASEIEDLKRRMDAVENFDKNLTHDMAIYDELLDSDGDVITDAEGDPILSTILFGTGFGEEEVIISESEPQVKAKIWINPDGMSTSGEFGSGSIWDDLDRQNIPTGERRMHMRGKYLGPVFTQEQKNRIKDGTFKGFFIGDYWEIGGRVWRIVDIDYWLGTGDQECTTHHLVIMPDGTLYNANMSDDNTTQGGYMKVRTSGRIDSAYEIMLSVFGSTNILTHRNYFSNAVTDGHVSGGVWDNSTIEVPNEIMMYGCRVTSAQGDGTFIAADYTIDKTQLALMKLNPFFINPSHNTHYQHLRDVVNDRCFSCINRTGLADVITASNLGVGIRPVFGIIG